MSPDTILVIEDDSNDLVLLRHALSEAGLTQRIEIEVARDGEAGLKRLLRLVEQFRATGKLNLPLFVLLDLNLPKMDGFEVLEEIRRIPELSKLVVIVLTSSELQSDVFLAYELGARSYLVKPPSPLDLISLVKNGGEMATPRWLVPPDLPEVE
jgi:CheY-like chemotaxis protein